MTQGKLTRTFVSSALNKEKRGNTEYFHKAKLAKADPNGNDRALTANVITLTKFLQLTKRTKGYTKVIAFVTVNEIVTEQAFQTDVTIRLYKHVAEDTTYSD